MFIIREGVQVQSLAWRHSSSETWYIICAGCCRVRSSARFRNYNWLQISKFIICTYARQPRKITKEKQKLSGMLICGFKNQNKLNHFFKMYIALFLGCFSTSLDKFVCSCCNKFALTKYILSTMLSVSITVDSFLSVLFPLWSWQLHYIV